jgi:hypothetical protein
MFEMVTRVSVVTVMCLALAGPQTSRAQTLAAPTTCPEVASALTALLRNDTRLRDWPNLARYREDNRTLPSAAGHNARVVFMGDSITDAWQQPRYGGFFPGKPYVDRGISGQTTPQMLLRFRPDVIDLQPAAVVILAGTNDIAGNTGAMTHEEIQGNLASMSELGACTQHPCRARERDAGQRLPRRLARSRSADDVEADGAHPGPERLDQDVRRRPRPRVSGLFFRNDRRFRPATRGAE